MMRYFYIFFLVFSALTSVPSFAEEKESPEVKYVITSYCYPYTSYLFGSFYFQMTPAKNNNGVAKGELFQISPEGEEDKLMWKTEGWYAHNTYISFDGKYLVRMGNWPRIGVFGGLGETLAIAFYKNGELLKAYNTADLIKDESKVVYTESHYFYGGKEAFIAPISYLFTLTTIDNIKYVFDVRTGEIVSSIKLCDQAIAKDNADKAASKLHFSDQWMPNIRYSKIKEFNKTTWVVQYHPVWRDKKNNKPEESTVSSWLSKLKPKRTGGFEIRVNKKDCEVKEVVRW